MFVTEAGIIDRYVGNQLWLWGESDPRRAGDNAGIYYSSPIQTVARGTTWKQVSAGGQHNAAIKSDGTLWLWGGSTGGVLGTNATVSRSSPVQTVSGGTNWKQVSAGCAITGAIKTDGTLWMWGTGLALADNTIVNKSSPVQTVSAGTNWKCVALGRCTGAAIKTDGTLWTWGLNTDGQVGDNSVVNRSSPVQTVSAGTNWKTIGAGQNVNAGIKTDGTLWMWGCNPSGNLGDNSLINRSSPVQTVSGGTNWKQVCPGDRYTAAIKTDGTLWVWGQNTNGQLGDNTIIPRSSPVQTISGGTNWKQVATGSNGNITAAVKTDGTLWLWGSNSTGLLGDNTVVSKSSPVQTVTGGTNWKQVTTTRQTLAVTFTEA